MCKEKRHFTDNYLINPTHPVTISLIGCGGTGSQVLSSLARINHTLLCLGHPGLFIRAYDDDMVTDANIGRQLFSETEIGLNKAIALISRFNRFYGVAWEAVDKRYTCEHSNIIITCVDNVKTRLEVSKYLSPIKQNSHYPPHIRPIYWLDFGNTVNTGQVVLGSVGNIKQPASKKFETVDKLQFITELHNLKKVKDKDSGPSCSLAEAINKQDLFINSTLAQLGCNLLWKLFREGSLSHSGLYLNLKTMNVNPIRL